MLVFPEEESLLMPGSSVACIFHVHIW